MKPIRREIIFIFSLFLFLEVILGGFVFAQRDLEVPLPGIGGETEITTTPLLPDYIKYIFNFAIGIGGLVVFVVLVYGGFRYLTSAGNPAAMADANNQIFSALLGLALLLGSWLILTTINPQLIVINPQKQPSGLAVGDAPGVYLCKDASSSITSADCLLNTKSAEKLGNFDNQTGYIIIKNSDDDQFGAIIHQDNYFKGRCAICLSDGCNDGYNNISYVSGVSSVGVFTRRTAPPIGEGITLYEVDEYNKRCGAECYETCPVSGGVCGGGCAGFLNSRGGTCWGALTSPQPGFDSGQQVWSIEINRENEWLAALFDNSNYQDKCEVFTKSDFDLTNNYIGWNRIRSLIVLPIKAMLR